MLIQMNDTEFGFTLGWIEPDLLELNISEYRNGEQHNHATRYISPEQLARLADYINDTLAT